MADNIYIVRQKKVCDNFSTCEERVLLLNEYLLGILNFSNNLEQ